MSSTTRSISRTKKLELLKLLPKKARFAIRNLSGLTVRDNQLFARCPAHNDNNPSLAISSGENGQVLIHCHAGCKLDLILKLIRLKQSDLFQNDREPQEETVPTPKPKALKSQSGVVGNKSAKVQSSDHLSELKESAAVSVITSTNPHTLTKRFHKDENGVMHKTTIANIKRGRVRTVYLKTLEEFRDILLSLANNQALAYGITAKRKGILITASEWQRLDQPDGFVPRTKQAFPYRKGLGIMMLDYDPGDDVLERMEVVRIFYKVCPGLDKTRFIWWPSSGSLIFEDDVEVIGLRGQRFYYFVSDATDIPRAGMALNTYLWAAGHGRIMISLSGSMLPRTLVDTAVWQGNHLDFASGAECDPPYEQRRGDPKIQRVKEGNDGPLNTRTAIPNPDKETQKLAAKNIAKAKAEMKDEALIVRQKWVKKRVTETAAELNPDNPTDPQAVEAATKSVTRVIETNDLDSNWIIHVEVDDDIVEVAVSEILSDPERWNGLLTQDPLEPEYNNGSIVGRLYLKGARPNLHSFAHGGSTYFLVGDVKWIEVAPGRDVDVVDNTLAVMRAVPMFFDFGDILVAFDKCDRMLIVGSASLEYYLGKYIQFGSTSKNDKGEIIKTYKNPPTSVCSKIIALSFTRRMKPLKGVITAPTIRPDGSLLDKPGYDPETQLLFVPDGEFPLIPNNPTEKQVLRAARKLWRPFRLFPFVDDVARGVHFAALLSALMIHAFSTRLGFAYDASAAGSGKTMLAQCVGAIVFGKVPGVFSPTSNDEEIRKVVFSALTTGQNLIIWDNVDDDFYSKYFANLLTTPSIFGRPLSESIIKEVPNTAMLIVTGNNLVISKDMVRRVAVARIVPEEERPEDRLFKFNPLKMSLKQRPELIAAGLTVMRGFISAGMPRQTKDGRLGSFEQWDDYVRQCVVWVGRKIWPGQFGDPLLSNKESAANDPDRESLLTFLVAWRECYGDSEIPLSEVMVTVKQKQNKLNKGADNVMQVKLKPEDILVDAIQDLSGVRGDLNSKSLGKALSNRKGRVVNGLRLVQGKKQRTGAARWKVEAL